MYLLTTMLYCLPLTTLMVFYLPTSESKSNNSNANEGCKWPCKWRNLPWYSGNNTVWFIYKSGQAIFVNQSLPTGKQFTWSYCIEHRGSFFIYQEFGLYGCIKAHVLSNTLMYFYQAIKVVSSYDSSMFCDLCDFNQMTGPIFVTTEGVLEDLPNIEHPIPCRKPIGCKRENNRQITCLIDDEIIDDGDACVNG